VTECVLAKRRRGADQASLQVISRKTGHGVLELKTRPRPARAGTREHAPTLRSMG